MSNEVLYQLTKEDIRIYAQQIGIDPRLFTDAHWLRIQKGMESGLSEMVWEVVDASIKLAIQEYPLQSDWQPHAENLTEHSARDYERYYREQGYEVKVVPSKRYAGRFDFYVKRR